MTFQLNFESMIEEDNRLQLLYDIEGDLPLDGYLIRDVSFTTGGSEFSIKYSITGRFVVETDSAYLQRINNVGLRLTPVVANPIDSLSDKINQHVSNEFVRLRTKLESPQKTLDEL
jgi:hypothetical protein|tara:strand:+ start:9861 stop:10208 length:348 start_codon:yes stop_codon:yes gene_type:complete